MVFEELEKESACFSCRYNLRSAILRLGPAGFKFEKYVAAILRAYNYDAQVPDQELVGTCVMHEVDVIAEKHGRRSMIEAKFRNRYNENVKLKDIMATWARFLDLVDAASVGKTEHLDEVWVVTNAKFSDRAQAFGVCKGMHLIGWNFPEERSLAGMVDFNALYPITVINGLERSELQAFSDSGYLLCREVAKEDPEKLAGKTGMSEKRVQEIISICTDVVHGGDSKQHEHEIE